MDVGIGLPNAVRGVERDGIVDWAQRAEAAEFSSLGTIDRMAWPNLESLISLAAAAAVTDRIGLTTDILLAPLRSNYALLAKQAASLDRISEGRLSLGLAVGGREDDYAVSGIDFSTRGKAFDAQLEELTKLWGGDGGVGPESFNGKRPGLLIGGGGEKSMQRAAKYADGWTMGGGSPDQMKEAKPKIEELWKAEGREGSPRLVALAYFGLGDDGADKAKDELGAYYAWLGDYADNVVASAATDADKVKGYVAAFEDAGVDELILFPVSADPDQVDRLAEAVK
jgi:alkanesulfonate monooxygenase SsuD/methylene tetrahydromethanopterin reductase-like flavin-dependent oxidoreductase (luciferase family)